MFPQRHLTLCSSVNSKRSIPGPTFSDQAKHKSFMSWLSYWPYRRKTKTHKLMENMIYREKCVSAVHSPSTYPQKNEIICISPGDGPAGLWLRYICTEMFLHCTSNHSTEKAGSFSEGGNGDAQKKLMRFSCPTPPEAGVHLAALSLDAN